MVVGCVVYGLVGCLIVTDGCLVGFVTLDSRFTGCYVRMVCLVFLIVLCTTLVTVVCGCVYCELIAVVALSDAVVYVLCCLVVVGVAWLMILLLWFGFGMC